MLKWLRRRWNKRLRKIDIQILWPEIKAQSPSLERARLTFTLHTYFDAAWSDLEPEAISDIVDKLD